jgi:hypothetical protein
MSEMLALPLLPLPTREEWNTWRTNYVAAALSAEHAGNMANAKVQWAMVHWTERMFEAMQDHDLTPTVEAEIQVIQIGDLMLIGVPGEYFVELGLQIKEGIHKIDTDKSSVRQAMLCGFTNGNVGYIPARRAYPNGGYEINDAYRYYGYPAAIAPEGGEQIVASAVEIARDIAK